ncbi:hypothetical protein ADUPG1_002732, partial [Aduncisulcus paluster]
RDDKGFLRSKNQNTLVIPDADSLRRDIFELAHSGVFGGHKGRDAVLRTFKEWRLGWKGMKKDVSVWISQCLICQRDRLSLDSFSGGGTTFVEKPFYCIAIDTMGPFTPSTHGYKYLIVAIDVFTRFVELIPTKTLTSAEAAEAVVNEVFLRYGFPDVIRSDNGTHTTELLPTAPSPTEL